jgi:hypothetical protein
MPRVGGSVYRRATVAAANPARSMPSQALGEAKRLLALSCIHGCSILKRHPKLLQSLAARLNGAGSVSPEVMRRGLHVLNRGLEVVDCLRDAGMRRLFLLRCLSPHSSRKG